LQRFVLVMAGGPESDPVYPEDLVRGALKWLLRGGTWEALARELAWAAVQAAGANYATIEWLTPLVEARLADRVDGVEFAVDMASVRARSAHLQLRPSDRAGADSAATLEGHDEAVRRLGQMYVEEVEWAVSLIGERLDRGRSGERYSAFAVRRRRPRSNVALPSALDGVRTPLGRRRRAA
jgi:hypothetical protein